MGWRFRKSIKLAPGIKINIGKKGISSLLSARVEHIQTQVKMGQAYLQEYQVPAYTMSLAWINRLEEE